MPRMRAALIQLQLGRVGRKVIVGADPDVMPILHEVLSLIVVTPMSTPSAVLDSPPIISEPFAWLIETSDARSEHKDWQTIIGETVRELKPDARSEEVTDIANVVIRGLRSPATDQEDELQRTTRELSAAIAGGESSVEPPSSSP